ncbi:FtsX-like permease family protein [Streptomyces sp. NPDC057908]|uniref:FtsX-like permease family protein n=1 Tax=Streptomyces sp. NPDC057908 TaxID=3346276 RepID=UPI0036E81286
MSFRSDAGRRVRHGRELKAVGFTPAQVVRAYVGQALIPAAVGTALGVLAGHLLAVPVLAETEEVYGTSSLTIAPWVDLAVIAGVLCLVAASAWRAGRLRTVDVVTGFVDALNKDLVPLGATARGIDGGAPSRTAAGAGGGQALVGAGDDEFADELRRASSHSSRSRRGSSARAAPQRRAVGSLGRRSSRPGHGCPQCSPRPSVPEY